MKKLVSILAPFALAACGQPAAAPEQSASPRAAAPASIAPAKPPAISLPEPATNAKSPQAAATVVETYYALLEQRDYSAAWALWAGGGQASGHDRAEFAAQFNGLAEIHAEVGAPANSEGACGSIYIDVPVVVRERKVGGVSALRKGVVTLRRVNDVDGATPDQLRWHINSIDLAP